MNPKPKSLIPGEVTKIPAKKAYGGGGQSLPRLGGGEESASFHQLVGKGIALFM